MGSAIYKISSYINKSTAEDANVNVTFKDGSNVIVVTATKSITKGDKINACYA